MAYGITKTSSGAIIAEGREGVELYLMLSSISWLRLMARTGMRSRGLKVAKHRWSLKGRTAAQCAEELEAMRRKRFPLPSDE